LMFLTRCWLFSPAQLKSQIMNYGNLCSARIGGSYMWACPQIPPSRSKSGVGSREIYNHLTELPRDRIVLKLVIFSYQIYYLRIRSSAIRPSEPSHLDPIGPAFSEECARSLKGIHLSNPPLYLLPCLFCCRPIIHPDICWSVIPSLWGMGDLALKNQFQEFENRLSSSCFCQFPDYSRRFG
jgi:hypothetical protein